MLEACRRTGTGGIVILPHADAAVIIQWADQRAHHEQQIITGLRAGQTTLQLYGLPIHRS
jgi:regulator of RNase E activity RraA